MVDLCITYGLREVLWVNKLASLLDSEGYVVCWEHAVVPGDDVRTDESIQSLNDAKCVLAIWSETSVDDFWVLSDAERAVQQDKLISVIARSVIIPEAFRDSEAIFMTTWDDQNKETEFFDKLMSTIAKFATPSQASQCEREQEKLARQQRMKAESERRKRVWLEKEERAKQRRMSV